MSGDSLNNGGTGTGTGTEQTSPLATGNLVGLYFTYGKLDGWNDQAHRGCSAEFGTAMMDTGSMLFPVPTSHGNVMVDTIVPSNTSVTWTATPDSANGFKFAGWYNLNDPSAPIRTGASSTNAISYTANETIILVPSFEPAQPRFTKPIYITVKGQDLLNAVEVSSMLGYYDYMLDSSVAGTTERFNTTSRYQLPDNQTITLKVRSMNGYNVAVTVNGSPVTFQTQDYMPSISGVGTGESTPSVDRGGASELSGDSDRTDTDTYKIYRIPNTGNATMNIVVEYTSTTMEYTLKVDQVPSEARVNTVYAYAGSEEPSVHSNQVTAEEGTTVHAVAVPGANYRFRCWVDNPYSVSGNILSTDTDYSFPIHDDITLYGVFEQTYTTISTSVSPNSSAGTAKIYVDGDEQPSPIRSDQFASSREIQLVAEANTDYTFLKWQLNGETLSDQSTIVVEFGNSNKNYTALFSYTPVGMVPFRLHTLATSDGTTTEQSTVSNEVSFDVKYTNQYGQQMSASQITTTEIPIESRLENVSGTYQTTLLLHNNLMSPIIIDDGTNNYRYEFLKFAYRPYGEISHSVSNISGWTDAIPDSEGNWTLQFPNYIGGRISTIELVAIYTKTLIYKVVLERTTTDGMNPSHSVWVSGEGSYASGDTVTISTGLYEDIDTNRYTFQRWINLQTQETFSTESEMSFAISSDVALAAEYQEYCRLSASSNNDSLGTVSVETEPVSGLAENWWPYNYEVEVLATPEAGGEFSSWRIGGYSPTSNPYTVRVNTDPTTIVGRFVEGSKTIKVYSSDGGTVAIQTRSEVGNDWETASPTSANTYRIPNGYEVRAVATPSFGYSFDGYVLYDEGSQNTPIEYSGRTFEIGELSANKVLNASFKYVPWISKLTPIIKVY